MERLLRVTGFLKRKLRGGVRVLAAVHFRKLKRKLLRGAQVTFGEDSRHV